MTLPDQAQDRPSDECVPRRPRPCPLVSPAAADPICSALCPHQSSRPTRSPSATSSRPSHLVPLRGLGARCRCARAGSSPSPPPSVPSPTEPPLLPRPPLPSLAARSAWLLLRHLIRARRGSPAKQPAQPVCRPDGRRRADAHDERRQEDAQPVLERGVRHVRPSLPSLLPSLLPSMLGEVLLAQGAGADVLLAPWRPS